jgi:predicted 3-demethylubiquinone-9 3-methyltransferase (glyoxalase superfamily)
METQVKTEKAQSKTKNGFQKITPFIWFDNSAEEAVNFYTSVFKDSGIQTITHYGAAGARASGREKGSVMTVAFQLEGQNFVAINGGPVFEINPSISFFVSCDTPEEINALWSKLSEGGTVLMELNEYPFSERFGWLKDKFGVTWQLMLVSSEQKITIFLTFTGKQSGKAEEAIKFYVSLFRNSKIIHIDRFSEGEAGRTGSVRNAKFSLDGIDFMAIDAGEEHLFSFNPAISLVVKCRTQEEIDFFWDKLSWGGDESAQQCGWLQDRFGISWQIIPDEWDRMMSEADQAKSEKLMAALLKMKKIDIRALQKIK